MLGALAAPALAQAPEKLNVFLYVDTVNGSRPAPGTERRPIGCTQWTNWKRGEQIVFRIWGSVADTCAILNTENVKYAYVSVPGQPNLKLSWGPHGAQTNRVWFWTAAWVPKATVVAGGLVLLGLAAARAAILDPSWYVPPVRVWTEIYRSVVDDLAGCGKARIRVLYRELEGKVRFDRVIGFEVSDAILLPSPLNHWSQRVRAAEIVFGFQRWRTWAKPIWGCALGYTALAGHSVLFITAVDILNTLTAARAVHRLTVELKRLMSPRLLCLDYC